MSALSNGSPDDHLYEPVQDSASRDLGLAPNSYELLNKGSASVGSRTNLVRTEESSTDFATYINADFLRSSDDGRPDGGGVQEGGQCALSPKEALKKVELLEKRVKVYKRLTVAGFTVSFLALALFGVVLGLILTRTFDRTTVLKVTGPEGPPGHKGDMGLQGLMGDQGDKGDKGTKGSRSAKGQKGDTGGKGTVGSKGATGQTGQAGQSGAKGQKGDLGAPPI